MKEQLHMVTSLGGDGGHQHPDSNDLISFLVIKQSDNKAFADFGDQMPRQFMVALATLTVKFP